MRPAEGGIFSHYVRQYYLWVDCGGLAKFRQAMAETRPNRIGDVVRTYSQRLFGFIRSRVRTEEDAEDILQDVWFQLSRIVDLGELENVGSWLYRAARNRIIDGYRKKKDIAMEDSLLTGEDEEWEGLLLNDDTIPEDEFFREIFWEELMAALDDLPANQRDVFVRNDLDGETLQEIADADGINLKTIISRKRYAVQHLRKKLKELYDELNDL